MKLKDKVAIVSGGARDIGRAVSVKLAAEGAKVVVNYFKSQEDADQTLREIEAVGGEAVLVKGDMTKQEDVDRLVAESVAAYGKRVDVLVNVANATALKREGGANEVADTVAYLASSESSYLTGVNLDINGGLFYS